MCPRDLPTSALLDAAWLLARPRDCLGFSAPCGFAPQLKDAEAEAQQLKKQMRAHADKAKLRTEAEVRRSRSLRRRAAAAAQIYPHWT